MTSKNNRANLLYYIKLSASFQIHRRIQTGVTIRKRSIRVKFGDFFLSRVTLEFDGWPRKTIGPLLHYIKPCASHQSHGWIQTGVTGWKRLLRVKIGDFSSRVTLKFNGWPWKPIGPPSILHQALCIISKPLVNSNWVYGQETPNSGQNQWFLVPCDLEI